jgi:large subunit ribosomal protein L3
MIREIFGKKLGMTQVFDKDGVLKGVTLIEIEPACLLEEIACSNRKVARIGTFKWPKAHLNKVKKPILGYFKKLGVDAYKLIKEVSLDPKVKPQTPEQNTTQASQSQTQIKKEFGVEIFAEGELVNVVGTTKGRGFAGGIKRHGWHGGPSSHGSMTHRRIGSSGSNTDPGRVVRGHRMPGHMGNAERKVKRLKILRVDKDKSLIFVEGAVPGYKGSILSVEKAGEVKS